MTEATTRAQLRAQRTARATAWATAWLTPALRQWAYGVTAAALGVAIFAGWIPPTAAPVIIPLLMAIFYVDKTGQPRT